MRVENWDSKLQKVIRETIEKDKFQYGKWYEDEVEDGGIWYELT